MKKVISLLLCLCIVLSVLTITSFAQAKQTVKVIVDPKIMLNWNGDVFYPTDTDGSNVYPIIYKNRTYLPAKFIAERAGITVSWDSKTQTVSFVCSRTAVHDNGNTPSVNQNKYATIAVINPNISLKWNGTTFQPKDANGENIYPIIYKGRTYLPARDVAEKAGLGVLWDSETRTVMFSNELATEEKKEVKKETRAILPNITRIDSSIKYDMKYTVISTNSIAANYTFTNVKQSDYEAYIKLLLSDYSYKIAASTDYSNAIIYNLNYTGTDNITKGFYGKADLIIGYNRNESAAMFFSTKDFTIEGITLPTPEADSPVPNKENGVAFPDFTKFTGLEPIDFVTHDYKYSGGYYKLNYSDVTYPMFTQYVQLIKDSGFNFLKTGSKYYPYQLATYSFNYKTANVVSKGSFEGTGKIFDCDVQMTWWTSKGRTFMVLYIPKEVNLVAPSVTYSGSYDTSPYVSKCSYCGGSGICPVCHGLGRLYGVTCEGCHGTRKCEKCHGTGKE